MINGLKIKSSFPPGISVINNITYVIPGWHIVPNGTTLSDINTCWEKEEFINPNNHVNVYKNLPINETIVSKRTGEKYNVISNDGLYWKCTCMGFSFRGKCKHIESVKNQIY